MIQACLLDAYQTILRTDYGPYAEELPRLAGVPAATLFGAWRKVGPRLTVGRITIAESFAEILEAAGVTPRPGLIAELAAKSRELLLKSGRRYDDTLPFLHAARAAGVKVAVVSNCDENTRDLLGELGITPLVDALALSCEVHAAKPSPAIYTAALDQLGVTAADALFVDDMTEFCQAAAGLGLSAVRIARRGEPEPVPGLRTVSSLTELEPLLAR